MSEMRKAVLRTFAVLMMVLGLFVGGAGLASADTEIGNNDGGDGGDVDQEQDVDQSNDQDVDQSNDQDIDQDVDQGNSAESEANGGNQEQDNECEFSGATTEPVNVTCSNTAGDNNSTNTAGDATAKGDNSANQAGTNTGTNTSGGQTNTSTQGQTGTGGAGGAAGDETAISGDDNAVGDGAIIALIISLLLSLLGGL